MLHICKLLSVRHEDLSSIEIGSMDPITQFSHIGTKIRIQFYEPIGRGKSPLI